MSHSYSWGILGPGKIAHRFAKAARNVPAVKIYAVARVLLTSKQVGSRSDEVKNSSS